MEINMKKRIVPLLLAVLAMLLASCGSPSSIVLPKGGFAQGEAGDTMRTYFFDFTLDNAYTCSRYEGYIPTPGYDLLAVELTIRNTHSESITMFDWDFIVLYDDNTGEEQIYDYPLTSYEGLEIPASALKTLLPSEYGLEKEESRTGLLLFEVPAGDTEFIVSYEETFEDGTTGDIFSVDIAAPRR